jgi:CDP-glycerol glycerophosphotransferase
VATTQEDLEKALVTGEYESDQARDRLANFRARFCEFDDGLAAERVVRRVFLGEPIPGMPR